MGRITVSNLGKAYKQYPNRWSRFVEWLLPDQENPRHTVKWVLKEVSFSIDAGEAVGIIGVNGAGKSTLLKMITGTTQSTTGTIEVSGRVAALLELGMGFHPDFTGRQNVIMAGQLQGLSSDEMQFLMPEIEAFAGIGDYIDQPVRIYSSGMQMRLAFSVATAKKPDILIVDEALSVGDAAFSRKCFQRIEDYRQGGMTLLFVSHDVQTVKKLCSKTVYLKDGALHSFGDAKTVCDIYEQHLFGSRNPSTDVPARKRAFLDRTLAVSSIEKCYGKGGAEISEICLVDSCGDQINVMETGSPFSVCYRVRFERDTRRVKFGMMLKTVEGVCIYGVNSSGGISRDCFSAGEEFLIQFSMQGNLAPGTYYLNVSAAELGDGGYQFLQRRVDCEIIRVVSDVSVSFAGCANLFAQCDVIFESPVDKS